MANQDTQETTTTQPQAQQAPDDTIPSDPFNIMAFMDSIILERQELATLKPKIVALITPQLPLIEPLLSGIDNATEQELRTELLKLCENAHSPTLAQDFENFKQKFPQITPFVNILSTNDEVVAIVKEGVELSTQANTQTSEDTQQPSEDTQTPPQDSNSTQDAKNLVQQATDELKQSGIELEEIIQNPPTIQVTPFPYPIDQDRLDNLNAFEEKLNKALLDSQSFREHTRLNLEGLSELYKISKDIYSFYETQISTLLVANTDTESLRQEVTQTAIFVNQSLETIQNATNTTLSIYKKCEAHLDLATEIYTKLDDRAKEMDNVLSAITSIKEQMQDLQALELSFKVLITKGEELRNQINSLVPNILNEVKTALLTDKENYENELNAQKTTYLQELNTLYAQINQTIQDFNTDYATKELNINEANDRIVQFLEDLDTKVLEVSTTHTTNLQELNDLSTQKQDEFNALNTQKRSEFEALAQAKTDEYNQHTADLNTLYEEKKNALTTQHTDIANQIDTLKTNTISEVNQTLETKRDTTYSEVDTKISTAQGELNATHTTLKSDLESLWEQYRSNLDAIASGEIATIKTTIETIQSNLQNYGLEHTRQTFTSNGTYTAPDNTLYTYVFVQGGTGNGVATSFGSYVSAAGGTGGGSQKGLCSSGMFKINANTSVNVVVGSGGICIVSTARKVTT